MSILIAILTRPSNLGLIAVIGSGALYFGLKSRTAMAKQSQLETGSAAGESQDTEKKKNYEVRPGRSGGGV